VKREIWNEKKPPEDECWQKYFSILNKKIIALRNTSTVKEFSIYLPGTNSAVERVFLEHIHSSTKYISAPVLSILPCYCFNNFSFL
jgi:hypothetical protein